MYEHRTQRLLTRSQFFGRALAHLGIGLGAIAVALCIGIAGYHYIAGLKWVDALLNASMILGGMGPVDPLTSSAAKVFASFYALFSGLELTRFRGHLRMCGGVHDGKAETISG